MYQGGETTDGRRIYVGNINYDFAENEIRNAFNDVRFALLLYLHCVPCARALRCAGRQTSRYCDAPSDTLWSALTRSPSLWRRR